jgi:NTE family protein
MLFHAGTLWRLNEAGYLPKLGRISSVSGGSITSAVLGLHWNELAFNDAGVAQAFVDEVIAPIRRMANTTIDEFAIARGLLLPGSISDRVVAAYSKHLYADKTLQDLPDSPKFVINAANLQSGALWRFTKRYMRDYKVCGVDRPKVRLAVAVAASSAFPPFLSPLRLTIDPATVNPGNEPLHRPPFTTRAVLTDGGVYDNLGLETVWKRCKTVFVSDGGGQMQPAGKQKGNWISQGLRAHDVIDNQVRALRKRGAVASFDAKTRAGGYWGMRTKVADYGDGVRLSCPFDSTQKLARVSTRLKRLNDQTQDRLINFGYAITDAALRRYFDQALPNPHGFPYEGGVG